MQLCPATVLKCQEAIPISNNEMRKIHRGGEEQPARPMGRKVNVSQSRREVHSAAENRTRTPKAPKSPKPPKEKSKHPILRFIGRTVATVLCLGIMLGSVVAVGMVFYVVQATANDGDLLDLDNIQLSQSSMVVATDPDTGAQVEYATLRSSNSHRVWADLEQIPSNLQYAFICTEDKDFYNEPGVNFKRTIGAMINEYLLPIYSSKQGASTLEQQLIKNLTDDNSASGIDGALRKVREIYRALCLSRSYSKETILEAYLNTISFTGTIQGVQTAANEYFNKDVSQLTLWECASIASITKNPTNYNPYTNPENLIHRRNFIMYNMWQQGSDQRGGLPQRRCTAPCAGRRRQRQKAQHRHLLLHRCTVQRGRAGHHDQGGHQRVRGAKAALHRRLYYRSHCQHQAAVPDGKPDAEHRRCLLPGGLA